MELQNSPDKRGMNLCYPDLWKKDRNRAPRIAAGVEEKGAESTAKVYQSRVLQILSEDTLEISMPMEQTRLILLPVDSEYDMIFSRRTASTSALQGS